jgi:hypothetical protein
MMKTAGDNFIWLGDLLKEEAKDLKDESPTEESDVA